MDKKEVLRDYVSDMLAVEKHCLESIERQTGDEKFSRYRDAHDLLSRIESTLSAHIFALDHYLETMDAGVGSLIKKAASSAVGAISGFYGKLRPEDPVSRSIRDDYTALNLVAVSYTMLHTTTLALDEPLLAEMAIKHLNEITPLIVSLYRVIPSVVAMELTEEGKISDPMVWKDTVERTHHAWSHEVVGDYH